MTRAQVQHLSEGRMFSAQNHGLGLLWAGEHSFPICSTGPKALITCDFRGPVRFKLLTTSEDLAYLGNCTTKPCWYESCTESSLLLSGTNHDYLVQTTSVVIMIILLAGVPSSQALPGFLIHAPPSVCVPAVLVALAVWIQNQKNNLCAFLMQLAR